MLLDPFLAALEEELRADFHKSLSKLLATARTRVEGAFADVAEERAKGLAEVAARRAELGREVAAMQKHEEAQEGRVELNIGGYRFETSVQALRRVPHTFFDAYFSGRYAQDVCNDGSIFVNRDGEHFGHVLEYMRDGFVTVAEPGVRPSISLLRLLKREFGFYCIELVAEEPEEPTQPEAAFVMGGYCSDNSSMERYDAASSQWIAVAAMGTERRHFGACASLGEVYVTGGLDGDEKLSSVEKYSPSNDTWSFVAVLPEARAQHAAVAVGSAMYVLGGRVGDYEFTASVLKYDSERDQWSSVSPMPGARSDFAACAVGNDIFVFGGVDSHYQPQASVFKYDTMTDAWSILASMPCTCFSHNANLLDALVYIVGGGYGGDVLRFEPASGVWSTLSATSIYRRKGVSFVFGGRLYAAGGDGQISSMERYDVASNAWTAVAYMLEGRECFGAATIGLASPTKGQDLFDSLIATASRQHH
jgi:hypothetical protein